MTGSKDLLLNPKTKNSLLNNSIDGTKKIISILLIISSLERVILHSRLALMKMELVPKTCPVLWWLLPPENFWPLKTLMKSSLFNSSSMEETFMEKEVPELLSVTLWELHIFTIISLNSLSPSMMVVLIKKMFWDQLIKESSLLPWLEYKLRKCMMDSKSFLTEVLLVSFGLKEFTLELTSNKTDSLNTMISWES